MRSTTQNNQRNRYAKETEQKKYCKVCHKAGKSEKEYTSHFTKSLPGDKGIVVCPTILRNLCQKCNKYGHFSDYCKESMRDYCKESRDYRKEAPIRQCNDEWQDVKSYQKPEKIEPYVPTYEEIFPALGASAGKKRTHTGDVKASGNSYSALGQSDEDDEPIITPKRVTFGLNYKKAIELEPVAPKEEEGFGGEVLVLSGRRTYVEFPSTTTKVAPMPLQSEFDNEDYYEEEEELYDWEQEEMDREAEIDRRLAIVDKYNNDDDDENW